MYHWVTTRKIPRTDGPNYPARAAQTVDLTVAKWIPVTAALLACFVTPARAEFDARYYESPNYPVRAVQTVDATVRTWQPADTTELASFSTPARPTLDVRRYEWAPAFVSIPRLTDPTVAKWEPAFGTELASFSTSARPSLDVRRYEWDVSESAWIQATAFPPPTVAQTSGAWTDDGGRTPAAPTLDVRRYEWAPQPIPSAQLLDQTVAPWAPIFASELAGFRTPAAPPLDVRRYDWTPAFTNIVALPGGGGERSSAAGPDYLVRRVIERTTGPQDLSWFYALPAGGLTQDQLWPAIWSGGVTSYVTPSRARLDVRGFEWAPPFAWASGVLDRAVQTQIPATLEQLAAGRTAARIAFAVSDGAPQTAPLYYPALTVGPSVAQQAPAWTSQAQSFRTSSAFVDTRQTIEAFVSLSFQAGAPTVAQMAPAWLGETQTFRTSNGPTLDLFRVQSIPDIFGVPDDWTLWTPALTHGERTPDRLRLDVRALEGGQPAWIFTSLPVTSTVAQQWPAILEGSVLSYRTAARPSLDVRQFEWQPAFSWIAPTVDAVVRTWIPVFDAEVGVRTNDGAKLDVRTSPWSPEDGWIFSVQPPVLTAAQAWPAIFSGVGTNFRTISRPSLDVRAYDWSPSFAWANSVASATVASWAPIFDSEAQSYRTLERARLDVRGAEWSPAFSWTAPVIDAVVARLAPVWSEEAGATRTGGRALFDVRPEWAPSFGWIQPTLPPPGVSITEIAFVSETIAMAAPVSETAASAGVVAETITVSGGLDA